jgi:threonine dehydrogenase-like Zn-dependent dehydrogenase
LPKVDDYVVFDPHIKVTRTPGFGELVIGSSTVEMLNKAFITVSKDIPIEKLVFSEPLSCAHHCVANLMKYIEADTLKNKDIAIVGAGMTGTLIGLLCKHYGGRITLINRNESRIKYLKTKNIFSNSEVRSFNSAQILYDIVIPTTTFLYPDVLIFTEKLVKNNGTILLYGGTKQGDIFPSTNTDIDMLRRKELLQDVKLDSGKLVRLCGTHGALTDDFVKVQQLLYNHGYNFPVECLISEYIRLDELPEKLIKMSVDDGEGKVIVKISDF